LIEARFARVSCFGQEQSRAGGSLVERYRFGYCRSHAENVAGFEVAKIGVRAAVPAMQCASPGRGA